ncbi:trypsin-like serine protease [Hyalangium minutum]|uniref:Putative secreted protein n=1 Tax=Hyalangium minutum TaxID=394096 RepID=A0A085W2S6_9BACT|nr:trypsin-like serine protease [Hyalangium minutum]KFE61989.1 putative secreted protein [Hyalangium minutum]
MHRVHLSLLLLSCLVMACGEENPSESQESQPALGQRSDAVVNGTDMNSADSGFALLQTSHGKCTATLHTNHWLITAKHCLTNYDLTYPHTVSLKMGSETRRPRRFILHPTEDLAIILLTEPFTLFSSDHSFLRPVYSGTAVSLDDYVLQVFGYGYNTPDGTGAGTLRYAELKVDGYADAPHYLLVRPTSGKQLAEGDSGGASIWRGVFDWQCPLQSLPGCIAGISIECSYVAGQTLPPSCTQLPGGYFHDWFYSNIQPTNAATFVSQSVPTEVQAGQPFTVSITLRNSGAAAWTSDREYRLGSQSPQDNNSWGAGGRVGLDLYDLIAPGGTKTFQFTAVAPNLDYTSTIAFQWRMLRENVEWFGDYTPQVFITVRGEYGDTPPDPCDMDPTQCEPPICDTRPWLCD